MAKRCFKASREQRQQGLSLASQQLQRRTCKQLERDQRRSGIARQSEYRFVLKCPESGGLPRLHAHPLKMKDHSKLAQTRLYQVIFPGRDAARNNQHVTFETLLQ